MLRSQVYRRVVFTLLISLFCCATTQAEIVYDFDDGTFQGWVLMDPLGEPILDDNPVSWRPSDEAIDIGDGFDLLSATTGSFRVVPDPWSARDCIGVGDCSTQILRSPPFSLDGSGDLTIDMMGGGAVSDRPFDDNSDFLAESADDLFEFKDTSCCQGYALRDAETGVYVLQAFSTGANDGKARPTDPTSRGEWETVRMTQEELAPFANDGKEYQVDVYDSYRGGWGWIGFDTVRIPAVSGETRLQAGDADQDLDFDQLDLVTVSIAAKYLSGTAASWGEGDWNGAPGGSQGNPPVGDGQFNQIDIIAALGPGHYLTGPYAAIGRGGQPGDGQTSLVYDVSSGVLSVDPPAGKELTSINISSAGSKFIGDTPTVLDGAFDNFAANNVFKATFGGSFGDITFGAVLPVGLSQSDVADDLSAVGSLAGGGDLGDVDLIFVPEPTTLILLVIGLMSLSAMTRRSNAD